MTSFEIQGMQPFYTQVSGLSAVDRDIEPQWSQTQGKE